MIFSDFWTIFDLNPINPPYMSQKRQNSLAGESSRVYGGRIGVFALFSHIFRSKITNNDHFWSKMVIYDDFWPKNM